MMVAKKSVSEKRKRPTVSESRDPFPEIASESLCDKVVASLKDAFFSGNLKPGDAIVERQLAQQMKIGSPAVREALITLEQQGFVRRVANTATYVNKLSADEVRQLYQLRIELELLALKLAKLQMKQSDHAALERLVDSMVAAAIDHRARDFFQSDLDFHRYCWKLSGNKYLERSLENLVPALFAFVLNFSCQTVRESVARQHTQIVSALKSASEPEFTSIIREALGAFAMRAISSIAQGHDQSLL